MMTPPVSKGDHSRWLLKQLLQSLGTSDQIVPRCGIAHDAAWYTVEGPHQPICSDYSCG